VEQHPDVEEGDLQERGDAAGERLGVIAEGCPDGRHELAERNRPPRRQPVRGDTRLGGLQADADALGQPGLVVGAGGDVAGVAEELRAQLDPGSVRREKRGELGLAPGAVEHGLHRAAPAGGQERVEPAQNRHVGVRQIDEGLPATGPPTGPGSGCRAPSR
jgi:hypothetical protein